MLAYLSGQPHQTSVIRLFWGGNRLNYQPNYNNIGQDRYIYNACYLKALVRKQSIKPNPSGKLSSVAFIKMKGSEPVCWSEHEKIPAVRAQLFETYDVISSRFVKKI